MPKPEIHYSHSFGMGFWIDEEGILMSCPAMSDPDGRTTMDVENAISVAEWDDPSVYTPEHLLVCLLYTSPSPRDMWTSRMPSSA